MAFPDGQSLGPAVPGARYSAQMGTAAGFAKGILQQPESASSSFAATAPQPSGPAEVGSGPPPQRIPRWLVRMELFLRVMVRMYIGLAICYAPWSHAFWDQNPVFMQFPTLGTIAANGAVRGIISGLGLLNLWFAMHDALRRRDG